MTISRNKKKKLKDNLIELVRADIDAAKLNYEENVLPAAWKRLQRFYCDQDYYKQLFPNLSKRCSFVMSDVADTIYWILPSLMRVFFGSTDPISIDGRTADDNPEPMKMLCNWQLQRKNKGFLIFYRWFLDALQLGHGVVKILWRKIIEDVEETDVMTPEQFVAFDPDAEGVKFIRAEVQPDGSYLVYVKLNKIVQNQPVICNVPVSEFWWLAGGAHNLREYPFVCHRRRMTRSEIEQQIEAGVYDRIDDSDFDASRYQECATDDELSEFYKQNTGSESEQEGASGLDKSRNLHWVSECYGQYDINDDNISEYVIVTVIGDKIVRLEENELKRPHFAVVSPYPDQYQLTGLTIDDMIGDIQDAKTALIRQIITNVANNNDRKAVVDVSAMIDEKELTENTKYLRVRLDSNRRAADVISYFPDEPLSPLVMHFMEYLDQVKENRTGVTRYNQGLDSKSLNKTATGITAIMGAANQRIEMIARMFSETGVIDLFDLLVEMNGRYLDTPQLVRLTGQRDPVLVKPDDIDGHFDLDVAAGVGAGQRQEAVQNMMLLLATVYPAVNKLLQSQGLQITPDKVANALKTLVEQMGYKDSTKYAMTDEELVEMAQAVLQATGITGNTGLPPGAGGQPPTPAAGGQPPQYKKGNYIQC